MTTRGFGDVLRIGHQQRPHLFRLNIRKPTDLYEAVLEIDERLDSEGRVLKPIDEQQVWEQLTQLRDCGIESLAVCLMNSYRNDIHERAIERIAGELDFAHVSCGVARLQKLVARGNTTVVDAYLTPLLRDYVASIRARIPQASLKLMTSAGGLVDAASYVGKDSILSGPAGGVIGHSQAARLAGFDKAIGFDMGGTSTDVSRFDGQFERRYEMELHDAQTDSSVRIMAPMLSIETVAAGGGSICWFDGQKLVVGPRSAGASPGPACYGQGGPLCVTDVNMLLGRIPPEHFAFPLDRDAVERRVNELVAEVRDATGRSYTPVELASGFTAIAKANMAAAIKKISVARGYDTRDHVLVSFGGAGGQHACSIARELGIAQVLQHPHAGVLSAYGIGMAEVKKFAARDVSRPYTLQLLDELEILFVDIERDLIREVEADGVATDDIKSPRRQIDIRYVGQSATISVPRPADGDYARQFAAMHRQLFGFSFDRPLEVHAIRVEVSGGGERLATPVEEVVDKRCPPPDGRSQAYFDGRWRDAAIYERRNLSSGDKFDGPAIVIEDTSTIVVESGWAGEVTARGDLLMTDEAGGPRRVEVSSEVDPIALELFNNRFAAIAEQMGATLEKTALSTNVKERLDFSCAIFDDRGDLVVNAPHIPVHLGAMSECVKCLIEDAPDMGPGDVFVTNDPFRGGSHLPDVTVVTPVFGERRSGESPPLLFFTASRAHHAEIGGITPGSMPPFSTCLAEEGVLIRRFRVVADGKSREDELRRMLKGAQHPSRAVDENLADVRAQVAANRRGADQLLEMAAHFRLDVVQSYMRHIQRAAEAKMRAALAKIPAGRHHFTDYLDDGAPISVAIDVRHRSSAHDDLGDGDNYLASAGQVIGEASFDFTGTGPVLAGNLNANRAIVTSAVLYCLRCLIDEDIPLNAGVLAPITISLPDNCLLNPATHADSSECPAVVGGNVETSQRIVDVIFGALQLVAASQGTMNNLTFGRGGTGGFGYYETIGGGAGAGPSFDGADAVHTHMTNTGLTDPEVLEDRYPVRLRKCQIRSGSGGSGRNRGGDGIVREIEFLEEVTVSLLTQRRTRAPYGLQGGDDGCAGQNRLRRADSDRDELLAGSVEFTARPGDVLTILTPGGGAFGAAASDDCPATAEAASRS